MEHHTIYGKSPVVFSRYKDGYVKGSIDPEEGVVYPVLYFASQYGWRDGCTNRDFKKGINARLVSWEAGNPYKVGWMKFEVEELVDMTPDEIRVYNNHPMFLARVSERPAEKEWEKEFKEIFKRMREAGI